MFSPYGPTAAPLRGRHPRPGEAGFAAACLALPRRATAASTVTLRTDWKV